MILLLSRSEAMELIERLPYIRTFQAPNEKLLEELFEEAAAKDDPLEWVKIIKTCYVRQNGVTKKGRPLTQKEAEAGEKAARLFRGQIAQALELEESGADAFIERYLAENM